METDNILLKEEKEQYQKEQNDLLKTVLDYRFFKPWEGNALQTISGTNLQNDANLEIFITNQCNQSCEYCYLVKYPDLYPCAKDHPTLINNLKILFNYLIEKDYYIPEINFFTGEIWQSQFGLDILDLTFEYCYEKGLGIGEIIIPSNCSFIIDRDATDKIQQRINKFSKFGIPLKFSISVDGKYVDNGVRPRNSKTIYTDEFYDNLFIFAKRNFFCFHPMISAAGIEHWSENYKWWVQMHNYYNIDIFKSMFFEVRNNDWTDEKIKIYCKLLEEMADDFLTTVCNNDITQFADVMAMIRNAPIITTGYLPFFMQKSDTFPNCTLATELHVRLGDLALIPCHRTCYNKYLYGHFVVEDDKIVDIKAINPQMAIQVYMGNIMYTIPGCDTCLWRETCLHQCFGCAIENSKDPFFPIYGVCKMLKAKYNCLMQYYKDKGIIDYYKTINIQELGADFVVNLLALYQRWEDDPNGMGTY